MNAAVTAFGRTNYFVTEIHCRCRRPGFRTLQAVNSHRRFRVAVDEYWACEGYHVPHGSVAIAQRARWIGNAAGFVGIDGDGIGVLQSLELLSDVFAQWNRRDRLCRRRRPYFVLPNQRG